jgi:hypothetical protein
MSQLFLLIGSIIALAVFYILLPQFMSVFRRFTKPQTIACPKKGLKASVGISPYHAAFTSLFDSDVRRVKRCSLWASGKDCNLECLENLQ